MQKLSRAVFGAVAVYCLAGFPLSGQAAPDGLIRNSVAVCDPNNPFNCLAPTVQGGLPGSGSGGGTAASQTATDNTDGQATNAANQQAVVFPYLFNGTTYDRWYGSIAGGARVNVTNFPTTAAGTSASNAQSVQGVTNGVPVPVVGTVSQTRAVYNAADLSASAFAANATISGAVRVSPTTQSRFNVTASATQAGTLQLYGCADSACATPFLLVTAALTAGGSGFVNASIPTPFVRVSFAGGAAAGTATAYSSFTAN